MEPKHIQEDLSHIRQMMEKSSRFISLSGLSGVFAGLTALAAAAYVYFLFDREGVAYFDGKRNFYSHQLINHLFLVGIITLIVALFFGFIFTYRKSRKKNLPIWDKTTRRLLATFAVPLVAGGIFCLALAKYHFFGLIAPTTLVFYGLALVAAERYTLSDVKYLGYCEIVLGLIALFFLGTGLFFWALGFGVLHIVYGILMYVKYK